MGSNEIGAIEIDGDQLVWQSNAECIVGTQANRFHVDIISLTENIPNRFDDTSSKHHGQYGRQNRSKALRTGMMVYCYH